MTEQEINNLKAGWQTDDLIAEYLFGWHKFHDSGNSDAFGNPACAICGRAEKPFYVEGFPQIRTIKHLDIERPPGYSCLRHAAYMIIDSMLKEGWSLSELSSDDGTYWSVIWEKLPRNIEMAITANANTDCLAIYKAGLKWKFGIII